MKELVRFLTLFALLLGFCASAHASLLSAVALSSSVGNENQNQVYTFSSKIEVEDFDAFSVVVPLTPPDGAYPWAKFRWACYAYDQDYRPLTTANYKFEVVEEKFYGMTKRYLRIVCASQIFFGKKPTKVTIHVFIESTLVGHPTNAMPSSVVFDGVNHMPGLPIATWAPKRSGIEQVAAMVNAIVGATKKGGRIWGYTPQVDIGPQTISAWNTPTDCVGSSARFISALRAGGVPAWDVGAYTPAGWHSVAVYVVSGKAFVMDVEALINRTEPALSVAQDWTIPYTVSMPATAGFEVHPGLRKYVGGKTYAGKSYQSFFNPFYFTIGGKGKQDYYPKVHQGKTLEDIMPPKETWKPLEVTVPTIGENNPEKERAMLLAARFLLSLSLP